MWINYTRTVIRNPWLPIGCNTKKITSLRQPLLLINFRQSTFISSFPYYLDRASYLSTPTTTMWTKHQSAGRYRLEYLLSTSQSETTEQSMPSRAFASPHTRD